MLNPQDAEEQLKKYLNKLSRIIIEAKRGFLSKYKNVDKTIIDDIFCCIDASFPDEYKNFLKSRNGNKLQSNVYYKQLLAIVKHKPRFGNTSYAIDSDKATVMITAIIKALRSDFKIIFEETNNG